MREQQIQRSHHIVHLGEHRMFAVDHRIRRRALFGKMNHRIRLEILDHTGQEIIVVHIANKQLDRFSGEFLPHTQPVCQRLDRRQALRAHLEVPLPANEIIDDSHRVSLPGQVERRGPTTITVTTQNADFHRYK